LKQTEFGLKQFAKRMRQPNFGAFHKWKKVWGAGFLEENHLSIIQGQNHLRLSRNGPLLWKTVVADLLATLEFWLPVETIDNA
jgi:hypothetical protein